MPGSSTATVPAAASALASASSQNSRWSADTQPSSAARAAPPVEPSSLAWSLVLEAVAGAGDQHPPGLLDGEGPPVAERVHELGQGGARRQHLVLQQVQVAVPVAGVLLGDQVGAEEGRDHLHRRPRRQPGQHLQAAALVVDGEAVARLGLQGGGAVPERGVEPGGRRRLQLGVGGGPGLADGAVDAAPGGQRLLVADPAQAGGELVGPFAGEHQVGVGVHEPGEHRPPAGVEPDRVPVHLQLGQGRLGPGEHDQPPGGGDRAAARPARAAHPPAPGRR